MPSLPIVVFGVLLIAVAGVLWYRERRGGAPRGDVGTTLAMFTRDLTEEARKGEGEPVVGRAHQIDRVIEILSRRTKNNPLLLGEPGVGKTAIVEGLAARMVKGEVPADLRSKKILSLDLPGLIGGTKYRGEFEQRIKRLVGEIEAARRQVILFIDEMHMLGQARGAEGALDIADILKPTLARGVLQVIGATTPEEYDKFIKPDETLDRRFQPVRVPEPTVEETIEVLRGIKEKYESFHGVRYDDAALEAAARLSNDIPDRFMPDKAIDLMDEAGALVKIEAGERGVGGPPTVTEAHVWRVFAEWKPEHR